MLTTRLRAYECFPAKRPEWAKTINSTSPGRAKVEYWHDLREAWPDIPFTDIRCRVTGPPETNESFRRAAEYRGVPFARVGMAVKVGGHDGLITGSNSSANFDVLFTSGPHSGLTLNCHPNHQMEFVR